MVAAPAEGSSRRSTILRLSSQRLVAPAAAPRQWRPSQQLVNEARQAATRGVEHAALGRPARLRVAAWRGAGGRSAGGLANAIFSPSRIGSNLARFRRASDVSASPPRAAAVPVAAAESVESDDEELRL